MSDTPTPEIKVPLPKTAEEEAAEKAAEQEAFNLAVAAKLAEAEAARAGAAAWYHICAAGAVGGLLAWFIAATFPGYFTTNSGGIAFLQFLKFTLGGAVAAMAAVYVIAHTDTKDFARAAGFAALCGVAWPAVINSGTAFVEMQTDTRGLVQKTENVQAKTQELAANPTPAQVTAATQAALEAAGRLNSSAAPDAKASTVHRTQELIATLKDIKVSPPAGAMSAPGAPPSPLVKAVNKSLEELSIRSDLPGEVRLEAASALQTAPVPAPGS
ncbi:MAG TPA: hypothetical protein VGE29_05590 [Prosthecobacter sp.]